VRGAAIAAAVAVAAAAALGGSARADVGDTTSATSTTATKPKSAAKPKPAKAAKATAKPKAKAKAAAPKPDVAVDIEVDAAPPAPPAPPAAAPPPPKPPVEEHVEVSASAQPLDEPAQPHGDGDTAVAASATVDTAAARRGRRHFHVSAGVLVLDPLSSSSPLVLSNVTGPASLAVSNGPIVGSGSTVEGVTTPAIQVGYDLPVWNHKLAIETVLSTPVTVKFEATGTLATTSLAPTVLGIPTGVPPLGSSLGEAKAVPPLVTLVYSPWRGARLSPYVGAGATVMFTYDAKVTNPILTEVNQPKLSVAPAPGFVVQAGLTAPIAGRFYARLDAKFIAGLVANATVSDVQVKTPELPLFSSVNVGDAKMSVNVNPLILQATLGADF
jgi:outer membrane protein W